jgi:phytoene synthase
MARFSNDFFRDWNDMKSGNGLRKNREMPDGREVMWQSAKSRDGAMHKHSRARIEAEDGGWREAWKEAYATGVSDDPVLFATAWVFRRFSIPFEYSEAFLQAMEQDLEKTRYATYEELRAYMYGSAAVVGLMMTHVIGFSGPEALSRAEALGYAMQLTNFLRDIREDDEERGRIYLPQDELATFGLGDDDIHGRCIDARFQAFMQFQVARADRLYEEANHGIPFLARRGRLGVRAGSDLYRMILRKIEQQHYDIYSQRARTSLFEKIGCVLTRSLL